MITLRPYQQEAGQAIVRSVRERLGLTFTIEIARQGGKNELSAQLETYLLTLFAAQGGQGIKASPTFKPQTINSLMRLKERLEQAQLPYESAYGYQVVFGKARWLFFSADEAANVVGATANILLEGDEAQDIAPDKWQRDFLPMGATANVTRVLYGTAWASDSLLEQNKQLNLELERRDGLRRHFQYDWREVGRHNPDYMRYVQDEQDRLGANHPLFQTQYELIPLSQLGRMFTPAQLTLMRGDFLEERDPAQGRYVAGLDIAGAAEQTDDQDVLFTHGSKRDSTVLTIGALRGGQTHVVKKYDWTDVPHHQALPTLLQLASFWHIEHMVVDATGMGEPVASMLAQKLGRIVLPYKFTASSKSDLAYNLLAAVNRAELKIHAGADPELWTQLGLARTQVRPNRTMNFYVEEKEGHDDFLMSLALTVEAARSIPQQRVATGRSND